ncbi:MAG: aldo/keto reductase [Bacteroidales bacterium]|nr:aldo/keto reductase [Bacteroidales bacterium]
MSKVNRRFFLQKVATGVASVGLLGTKIDTKASTGQTDNPDVYKGSVIMRTLGRTGFKLPIVSMGVMNADNPALISESYKLGMRHYDTAWVYQAGRNEQMVGNVIKDNNLDRESLIIGTKIVPHAGPDRESTGKETKDIFLSRFQESLERLQLDYVDILYLHNVQTIEMATNPYIIEALTELKDKKQIKFTGISTHVYWPDILNITADSGFYDVALITYNYSMAGVQEIEDAMKNAVSKGMGLIAMKTQCQQDWFKENLPDDLKRLYEGKMMNTALLKWVLNNEFITTAVPGFTTFQQMEEDFSVASDLSYSDEEKKFLDDRNVKLAIQGNCQLCGKCLATCPFKVNIPDLMRTHMYATSYGNSFKAKETLLSIPSDRGLEKCNICNECIASCIRSVKIAKRIKDLKVLYS